MLTQMSVIQVEGLFILQRCTFYPLNHTFTHRTNPRDLLPHSSPRVQYDVAATYSAIKD